MLFGDTTKAHMVLNFLFIIAQPVTASPQQPPQPACDVGTFSMGHLSDLSLNFGISHENNIVRKYKLKVIFYRYRSHFRVHYWVIL